MRRRASWRSVLPVLMGFVLVGCPIGPRVKAGANVRYQRIQVVGDAPRGGMADPTIAYDSTGQVGWLAYSAVQGNMKPVGGPYIETHIARSTDHGRTWHFAGVVNHSTDATGDLSAMKKGTQEGVWRFEVPTLVNDPGDPGREWKLFAHNYFALKNKQQERLPMYGWISMQTAHDPAGPWSEPIPLLGSGKNPPAPYNHTRIDIDSLSKDVADVAFYTEPGAFQKNGVLYLSLTARHPDPRLVLLSSSDHGRSWRFAGTLTTPRDSKDLGFKLLDASAIAEQQGRVFLLFCGDAGRPMHNGTIIVEFEDLAHGRLRRDANGRLAIVKTIPGQGPEMTPAGAGQAAYSEYNTAGGLVMAQPKLEMLPAFFQLWSTGQDLVGAGGARSAR